VRTRSSSCRSVSVELEGRSDGQHR
jgi:hypothetical protein